VTSSTEFIIVRKQKHTKLVHNKQKLQWSLIKLTMTMALLLTTLNNKPLRVNGDCRGIGLIYTAVEAQEERIKQTCFTNTLDSYQGSKEKNSSTYLVSRLASSWF
jgi:hypothetical protein